jgi:predicted metalloendopeptidase
MARTRFYPIWMLPVLLLASCGGTPSASASSSQTSYATTSSLPSSESLTSTSPGGVVAGAEEIAKAADVYYDKIVTGSSLLAAAGLSGQEELTYGNVVNLFYQAFKDVLPAPTGGRYLCGAPSLDVSAAPSSYQTGLKFLMDHGLYANEDGSTSSLLFSPDALMSASTLWTWIDRIHAYMGTSPQNDFFSSVNHDFLYAANNPLFAGVTPESSFRYTNIVNSRNIQAWVKKALGSTSTDPHLQSAKALYDSVFDAANRADRSLGLLSAVDALASTNEASFLPTLESLSASQGYSPLLTGSSFDTITDPNGSGYVLSELLSAPTYPNSLTGSDLTAYIATQVSAYSEVFKSLGLAEEKATSLGQGYGQALSAIIAAYQAKTTHYDRVRFTDLKGDIYGANFDLFKEFIAMGYSPLSDANKIPYVLSSHYSWMEAELDGLFSASATLEMKQAFTIVNEITHYQVALPDAALAAYLGISDPATYRQNIDFFYGNLRPLLSSDIANYYFGTSDYPRNLTVSRSLFDSIKSAFASRISGESWLSDTAKSASRTKLNAMKSSLFMTLQDNSFLSYPEVGAVSVSDGGSCYHNLIKVDQGQVTKWMSLLGQADSFALEVALIDPLTANAFYVPWQNGYAMTLGFLLSKDNFASMSSEQLYSDLGWGIGHEMTHGFDTNGIFYDESGNYTTTWWPAADQTAYKYRANQVVSFYDGYEVYPGLAAKGEKEVSENVADLGGIRLLLDLGASQTSFDYGKFFNYAATNFCDIASRSRFLAKNYNDVHAFGRVRINRCFASLNEFANTYSLREGDHMYVAPSDRVAIW